MEWCPLFVAAFLHLRIFPVIAKIIFAVKAGPFWEWLAQRLYSVPICAHHYIHRTVAGVFLGLNVMTQNFYLDTVLQTHTSYLEYLKFYGSYQNICVGGGWEGRKEKRKKEKKRNLIAATLFSKFIEITFHSLLSHTNALLCIFTVFLQTMVTKYMHCTVYLLFHYRGADKSLARTGRKQATVTKI